LGHVQASGVVKQAPVSLLANNASVPFLAVTKTNGMFSSYSFDGILGLGLNSIVGAMTPKVFGICLSKEGGDISFGANVDVSKRSGNLDFVSLAESATQWAIKMSSMTVQSSSIDTSTYLTIVDSGTT
jgi:hypothetical protein